MVIETEYKKRILRNPAESPTWLRVIVICTPRVSVSGVRGCGKHARLAPVRVLSARVDVQTIFRCVLTAQG